jgi:hypothetical protein
MPTVPVVSPLPERAATPVTIPTLTPPPMPTAAGSADRDPPRAEPAAALPAVPSPGAPAAPAPLPGSVTEDQFKWQPTTGPAAAPGNWAPAGKPQTHAAPPPEQPNPVWQEPRRSAAREGVARGQVGDDRPDPTVALIRQLCDKRAAGVEVKWTGGKRLAVSFDCRTAAEAQKLVNEISARPELGPLQIDFRVGVK